MEASDNQSHAVDHGAARAARAVSSLTDDFHRQGGTLQQAQVDRTIEKRRLTPDEGVRVQQQLRDLGMTITPSLATGALPRGSDGISNARPTRKTDSTNFDRLLADPRCHKFLTEQEEVELGRAARLGRDMRASIAEAAGPASTESLAVVDRGERARERMIISNIRLVAQQALAYGRLTGLPPEDLLQDGLIGLMRAVEGYDHTAGFRFSTYATWWIRQAITRAIDDTGLLIRVPVHCAEHVRKLKRVQRRMERMTGKDHVSLKQLSDELNWDPARIRFLQEVAGLHPVSFDEPAFDDEDSDSRWQALPDPHPGPAELVEQDDTREFIEKVLQDLPKREADVLTKRFGLDGSPPMTLEEIGALFDVTRERIRQLESKALLKLGRRSMRGQGISDLLDYEPTSEPKWRRDEARGIRSSGSVRQVAEDPAD
jgi:RNA polymerase primary sigma factor